MAPAILSKRGARPGQDAAQRALADRQAEQLAHNGAQALKADGVGVVQGDHHGPDAPAKGQAWFQARGRRGDGAGAAAKAAPAEQAHAGDMGLSGGAERGG